MSKAQTRKIHTFAAGLLFLAPWVSAYAQSTSSQVQPDNTKVNQRDRNQGEVTADQQKMNPEDRALSAKIRQAIVADKALSTYAHNIKVISQNGIVTLKGPVHSEEEVKVIMSKAKDVTGSAGKVINQMTVTP